MNSGAEPDGDARARAALRERLGAGARFDAPMAPGGDLLLARRGMAYFARLLHALRDETLNMPRKDGVPSRRQVVAAIGCRARDLAIRLHRERTGAEPDWEGQPAPSLADEIASAVTLPAVALRHLCTHAQIHLDVEWRDLGDEDWDRAMPARGRSVPVRATPRIWAGVVWNAALALDDGGRERDVPPGLTVEPAIASDWF